MLLYVNCHFMHFKFMPVNDGKSKLYTESSYGKVKDFFSSRITDRMCVFRFLKETRSKRRRRRSKKKHSIW